MCFVCKVKSFLRNFALRKKKNVKESSLFSCHGIVYGASGGLQVGGAL